MTNSFFLEMKIPSLTKVWAKLLQISKCLETTALLGTNKVDW